MAHDLVVGVDTSDASRRAVEYACREVKGGAHSEVLLVHIIPWSPYSFSTPEENEYRSSRKQAEVGAAKAQIMEPLSAFATECGIEVSTRIAHGDRVDLLLDIAEAEETQHIVVGRTGDTGIRGRLFGTVPSILVQQASVPVTVVP